MIITKTPFRVTLGGGGTDLASYYGKNGGFVFAMSINKYMNVIINRPSISKKIILHYWKSEVVDSVDQVRHDLAREALMAHGIESAFEITSIADIPSNTGLGSSSCYLVGLLNALHYYRKDVVSLGHLAEEACDIEIGRLGLNIGKQDQYMAAYGGMSVLDIAKDGVVRVSTIRLSSGDVSDFVGNTHMYYLGGSRSASDILQEQDQAMKTGLGSIVESSLDKIKDIGHQVHDAICERNFDKFGLLMDEHWKYKRRLSGKISNQTVDDLYEFLKVEYNVLGGKIVGAGGGGFLMLYCTKNHIKLQEYMESLGHPRLDYTVEHNGTQVIANY